MSEALPARHQVLGSLSDELAELVARVVPAVAAISGEAEGGTAAGSGFAIDAAGHIVTNHHLVAELRPPVLLALPGRPPVEGRLVGVDTLTDLAVLRVRAELAVHLELRDAPARVGELCLGLGSPFGRYPESAALGIVSGLARTIPGAGGRPIERVIQTDGAISPGNSGGPLVDVRGQVLGVNTCVDAGAEGIGFAVPADTVRNVVGELIEHGVVERGALGVAVAVRETDVDGRSVSAVTVVRAPRAASALLTGDAILAFDGVPVRDRSDLYVLLTRDRIGRQVPLSVYRDGRHQQVDVEIARFRAA